MDDQSMRGMTNEEFHAWELAQENKVITDYTTGHAYPSYPVICRMLSRAMELQMQANYSNEIHLICKRVYENFTNRDIVRECGVALNNLGGINAMHIAGYALQYFSPIIHCKNPLVRGVCNQVDWDCDGIGKWVV